VNFFRRLIYVALISVSGLAIGAEFSAKVIAVMDGDTVLVLRKGGLEKIRLAEIDAPEKAQAFGESSRRSLSGMVLGKQVNVVSQAVDQYGRLVAHISINGLDVNAEQIRSGMAWEYSRFASLAASRQSLRDPLHRNRTLIELQEEARQASRGLWAQGDPTPPWDWRKLHPNIPRLVDSPALAQKSETAADTSCGNKRLCSEMSSCEEALHYLMQCGVETLDGNGDGVPCEKLCAPLPQIRN